MRIVVVAAKGLPPEVCEAVLRAEGKLNAELQELLTPEGLERLRNAEVQFDLRILSGERP